MNKAEVKVDTSIPSILKQRIFERRELISQEDLIKLAFGCVFILIFSNKVGIV